MTRRHSVWALIIAMALVVALPASHAAPRATDLPARLSDQEFWRLVTEFSEADGSFRSDNLLSNEIWFQYIVPDLVSFLKPGGVYLGVGPEQNFTYIAALKPRMVFIIDVRRGNLHTQLMYKALFELAADRADFVSLLFSRKRPEGLTASSSVQEIFSAIAAVAPTEEVYNENVKRMTEQLTKKRSWSLPQTDVEGLINNVYWYFYSHGPSITYNSSSNSGMGRGSMATYYSLQTSTDGGGQARSYLATEANFQVLKDLQMKNLVVPVVGDFAGPKAIRSVGKYLKAQGANVTAFYLSNVEQYLQGGLWQSFCNNVASLPLLPDSTFIYSQGGGGGGGGGGLGSWYRPMQADVKTFNCTAGSGRP